MMLISFIDKLIGIDAWMLKKLHRLLDLLRGAGYTTHPVCIVPGSGKTLRMRLELTDLVRNYSVGGEKWRDTLAVRPLPEQ
jgi:hypothetical protein